MAAELSIVLKLVDNATAALKEFGSRLAALEASSEKTAKSTEAMAASGEKHAKVLEKVSKNTKDTVKHNENLSRSHEDLKEKVEKVWKGFQFLTKGILTYEAVHLAKEFAEEAAHAEKLALSLKTVGENAGLANAGLQKTVSAVKELGIRDDEAMTSLTKLVKSGVPPEFEIPLAKAARDLAVIAGTDPSRTLQDLSRAIEMGNPRLLKRYGIVLDANKTFAQTETKLGIILDKQGRSIATTNAILAAAAKTTGAYEDALGTAAGQMQRNTDLTKEMKEVMGKELLPVYKSIITGVNEVTEAFIKFMEGSHGANDEVNVMGEKVAYVNPLVRGLAEAFHLLFKAITGVVNALAPFKDILVTLGLLIAARFGIAGLMAVLGKLAPMFAPIVKAARGAAFAFGLLGPSMGAVGAVAGGLLPGLLKVGAVLLRLVGGPLGLLITVLSVGWTLWETFGNKAKKSGEDVGEVSDEVKAYAEHLKEQAEALDKFQRASKELRQLQTTAELGKGTEEEKDALAQQIAEKKAELEELEKAAKEAKKKVREEAEALAGRPLNKAERRLMDETNEAIGAPRRKAIELERQMDAVDKAVDKLGQAWTDSGREAGTWLNSTYKGTKAVEAAVKNLDEAMKRLKPGVGNVKEAFYDTLTDVQKQFAQAKNEVDLAAARLRMQQMLAAGKDLETGRDLTKSELDAIKAGAARTDRAATIRTKDEQATTIFGSQAAEQLASGESQAAATKTKALNDQLVKLEQEKLQQIEALQKQAYERGITSDQEFYAQKAANINKDFDLQQQSLQNQIRQKESEQVFGYMPNLQKQAQLATMRAQVVEIEEKRRTALANNRIELEGVEFQNVIKARDALLSVLELEDARAAALTRIDVKYADQLRELGKIDSAMKRFQADQINKAWDAEKQKVLEQQQQAIEEAANATEKFRNDDKAALDAIDLRLKKQIADLGVLLTDNSKVLAKEYERAAVLEKQKVLMEQQAAAAQRRSDLIKSVADVEASAIDLVESKGGLSPLEAQGQRNIVVLKQIEALQVLIANDEKELAKWRATSGEVAAKEANRLEIQINNNIAAINNLKKSYQSLADTLRGSFTQALESLIESAIEKPRLMLENLKNFAKTLASDMNKLVAKELAQKGADKLSEVTGGDGKDVFSMMAKLLGGDQLGTELRPMVVKWSKADAAMNKMLGLTGKDFVGGGGAGTGGAAGGDYGPGEREGAFTGSAVPAPGLFSNLFSGFKTLLSSLTDSLTGLFKSLSNGLSSLFSGGGSGGDFFSWIGSLFMADGGLVSGPGTGTSDSVSARLSNGEYVVNAKQTRAWLPWLEAINFGNLAPRVPHFAAGGLVAAPAMVGGGGMRPVTVIQNIQTPDVTSFRRSRDQVAKEMALATRRSLQKIG